MLVRALISTLLALNLSAAQAQAPNTDLAGSQDHPLIQRFSGSLLLGYAQDDWVARSHPSAEGVLKNRDEFGNPLQLEGKLTRLFYLAPLGKSPLEVFRNYQQALLSAGFKPRFSCDGSGPRDCAKPYFALKKGERGAGMGWVKGYLHGAVAGKENSAWSIPMALSFHEGRMLSGSLQRAGQELHVLLYTSAAENEYTRRAATYIEIVEPKAMQTGQVTVDAKAIAEGLRAEGRVTLSGLFFDTGKTELKPESATQLEAMSQLLQAQAQAKVFIVGHTDNVGGLEANQALSQARAQAVVAALTATPYRVDAKRLQARGVGPLAPQASNADEAGRAKNRRVEMVLQ